MDGKLIFYVILLRLSGYEGVEPTECWKLGITNCLHHRLETLAPPLKRKLDKQFNVCGSVEPVLNFGVLCPGLASKIERIILSETINHRCLNQFGREFRKLDAIEIVMAELRKFGFNMDHPDVIHDLTGSAAARSNNIWKIAWGLPTDPGFQEMQLSRFTHHLEIMVKRATRIDIGRNNFTIRCRSPQDIVDIQELSFRGAFSFYSEDAAKEILLVTETGSFPLQVGNSVTVHLNTHAELLLGMGEQTQHIRDALANGKSIIAKAHSETSLH